MEPLAEQNSNETRVESGGRPRSILTARRPGIEHLLGALPIEVEPFARDRLRSWTLALTAEASRWQVEHAKQNALARRGR